MKLLLCMSLIVLATACQVTKVTNGVPNLRPVKPGMWRGGQPTEEGWSYLYSLGVRNVVKLNPESEASDEGAWKRGMVVYYVPVSFRQQMGLEPLPANFSLGYESSAGGTYIHCQHGQDRTGLFCAIRRVKRDGWTKAAAEKEMLDCGFHKELIGLWEYWEGFCK